MAGSPPAGQPRFLADVMLGTLAKWLRVLGYDTVYDNRITDDEIIRRCVEEDRIALTRDRRLVQRRSLRRSLLLESDELDSQLWQVIERMGGTRNLPERLSRCIECNEVLQPVNAQEVQALIPDYVFRTQARFKRCPSCGRIYWPGTHRDSIEARLKKMIESRQETST